MDEHDESGMRAGERDETLSGPAHGNGFGGAGGGGVFGDPNHRRKDGGAPKRKGRAGD